MKVFYLKVEIMKGTKSYQLNNPTWMYAWRQTLRKNPNIPSVEGLHPTKSTELKFPHNQRGNQSPYKNQRHRRVLTSLLYRVSQKNLLLEKNPNQNWVLWGHEHDLRALILLSQ